MIDETAQHNPSDPGKRRRQRSHGQSIVEFALVLPLMLFFLAVAADFGRAYTAYLTVSSSAREGAIYAARSVDNANDETAIETRALEEVGADKQIWGEDPTVVIANDASQTDDQGYRYVEVTVQYTFIPLFPIGPIPDEVDMERTVRMRILGS